MSNLNQATQPNKPLGDGAKAGAISENRILYVLLFVLIGVFFWEVSNDDDETKTISQDDPIQSSIKYEEVISRVNPNVDVEIMDADLSLATTEINASKQKNKKDNIPKKSKINPDFYKSYNLKQMPITNSGGFDNIPAYDYNYIFAGNVDVPEGTFAGMDDDGFAILIEKRNTRALLGGGVAQGQTILPDEFYSKEGNVVYENIPSSINSNSVKEYPNTEITYGTEVYPLDDTLGWHPYESLAYLRDKKEFFVAKKVRDIPTARDLEQYIPPNTLGDRDTRMGYGVVIRPRK